MGAKVGLSSHLFWLGQSDAEAELKRLRSSGAGWIREDFLWDQIQPSRGVFNWSRTDALMAAAARTGTNVLAILDYSAKWASSDPSGKGNVHYPPKNVGDYAAFARAVVERYGSDGSFWRARPDLPAGPLGAVELWNEPWGAWFWKPNPDPAAYARLVRAAATAIRAAKPDTKILISGDPLAVRKDGKAAKWLDAVLAADPGLRTLFDAYSTHPYPSPRHRSPLDTTSGPEYRFNRAALTRQTAAKYQAEKPIWITEVGWSTAADAPETVTEATQATYIGQAIEHAIGVQAVERIFIFGWDRSNGIATDREGNYGLQRKDGSLKPAWETLTRTIGSGVKGATLASAKCGAKSKKRSRACGARSRAARRCSRKTQRGAARVVRYQRGKCRKVRTPR
jgi:Cellulase (glycosyl hydrolase family 5)